MSTAHMFTHVPLNTSKSCLISVKPLKRAGLDMVKAHSQAVLLDCTPVSNGFTLVLLLKTPVREETSQVHVVRVSLFLAASCVMGR